MLTVSRCSLLSAAVLLAFAGGPLATGVLAQDKPAPAPKAPAKAPAKPAADKADKTAQGRCSGPGPGYGSN